jgi:hypothetical protein
VSTAIAGVRDELRRVSAVRQQSTGPFSATILTSVATALSGYAASHPAVFAARAHGDDAAGKMRSRVPEHARLLLAHATALCAPRAAPRTISAWRISEAVARVLSKTELGEYSRLWENGGGSSSVVPLGAARAEIVSGRAAADATMTTPPLPVAMFFGSWYRESSLVLRTSVAMGLVMKYAAAEAAHRNRVDCPGGDCSEAAADALWELLVASSATEVAVPRVDLPPARGGGSDGSDILGRLVDYVCDNGALSLGVSFLASSVGGLADTVALSVHEKFKAVAQKVCVVAFCMCTG